MAANDTIYSPVKQALIKDGWVITDDPYALVYQDERLYADLAAERALLAEKSGSKIVVEIKSFLGASIMSDLYEALGQCLVYRTVLAELEQNPPLFLALRDVVYDRLQQRSIFRLLLERHHLALLIVDTEREEIVQWINRDDIAKL